MAAFAAFRLDDLTFDPPLADGISVNPGVTRWFCRACGSPLAGQYDYLPGQIYVSLGLIDQADTLAPDRHSHAASAMPWLHIADDLPRDAASGREALGSDEVS